MKRRDPLLTTCALLAALTIGCGGDDPPPADGESSSQVIGSGGGELRLRSGVKLSIPRGALSEDTEITLEERRPSDYPGERDHELLERPVRVRPADLGLEASATLEIPVRDKAIRGGALRALRIEKPDAGETRWERIEGSEVRQPRAADIPEDARRITFTIDGGGDFTAARALEVFEGKTRVSATIGRDGGRLQLRNGTELTIPAGSLERELEVELTARDRDGLARPRTSEFLEEPVSVSPSDARLDKPAVLEIPVRRADLEEGELALRELPQADADDWSNPLPGTRLVKSTAEGAADDERTLERELESFGTFAATRDLERFDGDSRVEGDVTRDGAYLSLDESAALRVPEGALDRDTSIEMERMASGALPTAPAGYEIVGRAVAIRPHGTAFDEAATLEVAVSDDSLEDKDLRVALLDDEDDPSWEIDESARVANFGGGDEHVMLLDRERLSVYVLLHALDGSPGAPDGGVEDASAMAMDAAAPDGATVAGSTVAGRVVSDVDLPLADVSVTIGSSTVMTNAAGEFTISDVAATYDAVVIYQDTNDIAVVYQSLTRRDPVFRLSRAPGEDYTTALTGSVQAPATGSPDEASRILFGSSEIWSSVGLLGDDTFSMSPSWSGPESTVGTLHGLRWFDNPGAGIAKTYTAYGSAPLTLTGPDQQAALEMLAISSGSVSGTLVLSGGYEPGGREFFAALDENTIHHLVSIQSASPLFTDIDVPVISNTKIQIRAKGTDPAGGFSTAIVHVDSNTSNIEISVPERPNVMSPADDAVGVLTDATLEWSPLGGNAVVSVVQFSWVGTRVTLVTTDTTTTLPSIPGFEFSPDTLVFWIVYGYGPFADVDAFVAPGAPVDIPSFNQVSRVRTDLQHAYSDQWRFQMAP